MRSRPSPFALLSVLAAASLASVAPPAQACALAYPQGEFARVAAEHVLIVWDAARSTEHFVHKPAFDGDARRFGFFVPTPTVPRVAKADDAIFDRAAALVASQTAAQADGVPPAAGAGDVEVTQRVHIDDFDLATLRATGADALVAWLHTNAFADRPGLRAWAAPYLAKGWAITAMRYAPPRPPPRATLDGGATGARAEHLEAPTLRFSFTTDAPFYPYREPAPDGEDQSAFLTRTGQLGVERRPLHVWVIAGGALEAFDGDRLSGPYLHANARVSSARVAVALGPTRSWGFDPAARPEWTVTYLTQFEDRDPAAGDLTFAPAKVLATAEPAPAPEKRRSNSPWPKRRLALAALALATLVAAFTWLELRAAARS